MFNIVLVEPEIPQNTGNIARTCAATGASLHLVHPLGFSVDDRSLKRAGLDYWHLLDVHHYDNLEHFLQLNGDKTLWLATTKGSVWYTEVSYQPGDFLLFGRETRGLPAELLAARPGHRIRLPMRADARSLNLSNSVAIVVYEAMRQHGFAGLK